MRITRRTDAHSTRAPRSRRPHARPEEPPAPPPLPEQPEQQRHRRSGGPLDAATYTCTCGVVFEAKVSTSVHCPRCGAGQAW